jgi:prepilin-type N-terminal cleavage/methylation domain-containing protein
MQRVSVHTKRGFTLAEMLLSMSLTAVLMLAAAFAIYAAERAHTYSSEKNQLIIRARGVTDRIAADIRRCTSFTATDGSSVAVQMPNGLVHTYQYSAAGGGTVLYFETDALGNSTPPAVLTAYTQTFTAATAGSSCQISVVLKGTVSECQVTSTATPGKVLF